MLNANVLKWVGIVDGIIGAGAAIVAQAEPSLATWCHIIIAVVGVVGTSLGVMTANSSTTTPAA